jgi:APA family basic amino acid/polyamine antiporter
LRNQLFARKSIEILIEEMHGDNRLRRALGPVSLTSLGVGATIGAGIFALTGRAAAQDAGPAILISYIVAGIGCALAAMCYAEVAAMVPVAGSAYTYAYATLGELFAWIIGWDLILEYAMGCSTVAAAWSGHFREFLEIISFGTIHIPAYLMTDPVTASRAGGTALFNMPAVLIMVIVSAVLVVGIRESARTNNVLVIVKTLVVIFVIFVGLGYVIPANWTGVPVGERLMPEDLLIAPIAKKFAKDEGLKDDGQVQARAAGITKQVLALAKVERERDETTRLKHAGKITSDEAEARVQEVVARHEGEFPQSPRDRDISNDILASLREQTKEKRAEKWGILGLIGINHWLLPIDDACRTRFSPYGFSGIMLGAAIIFFAYIGFDSISTHAEEAIRPKRDVPIGIIASLAICTLLYIGVAIVITGLVPYPTISFDSAIATAFRELAEREQTPLLHAAALLIAVGALAGMTSVLLVTFLSQARIFLAMARDGLLPQRIFGDVHPRFRTPHKATILTGFFICVAAAFTPIDDLGDMVSIGTLMAFVIVCAAVLILRKTRPDVERPFRCPAVSVVATLGVALNLGMMLFLSWLTWLRLVLWLIVGLVIYFFYGRHHSAFAPTLEREIAKPGMPKTGTRLDEMRPA